MLQNFTKAANDFFAKTFSAFTIRPSDYTTPDGSAWAFNTSDGNYSYFRYEGFDSCTKAYTKCPELNAIVNAKAQAYITGETWILNRSGKGKGKEAESAKAKSLRKVFAKPNPLQSWDQFEAQMYIFVQVYGYCPILMMRAPGYADNIDVSAMWCIPPPMVSTTPTRKLFQQTNITGILEDTVQINWAGQSSTVSVKDICFIRDITPTLDTPIFPVSRIQALEWPINNAIGAYESRNVLINYRGALGIFSRDTGTSTGGGIPAPILSEPEKEKLQEQFKRYGLRGKQWQFIITSAAIKWQQVSVPTKDLMLFEEVEEAAKTISNSYRYPYPLLASTKGTTFNNLSEGKKLLYQDGIMPEAKSIYGQLNTWFGTESHNLILEKDYSKVPVLQQDQVKMMEARLKRNEAYKIEWDNGLITLDMWLIANGEDPRADEIGKMYKPQLLAVWPLVQTMGVQGVQAAVSILTANLPSENKRAALELMVGMSATNAARLTAGLTTQSNSNETGT